MAEKKLTTKDHKEIFLSAWRARRVLRLSGFLTDSQHTVIFDKLEKYQTKHSIKVSAKELQKI